MPSTGRNDPPALSDENSSLILRERDVTLSMMMMNDNLITDVHLRDGHDFPLSDEESSLRFSLLVMKPHHLGFPDDEESSFTPGVSNNTPTLTESQSGGST